MKKFKYIDLFSGVGGFHQAMKLLGGECVFSSEIDKFAIATYEKNYDISSNNNIKDSDIPGNLIPKHDVLCAGFPCQAFSKAGKRLGFMDETKGTLFFDIERILERHRTKYIILENVRNLISHDDGNTCKTIYRHLNQLGYRLTPKPIIMSPHQLGIPQLRERVVILGVYDPLNKDEPLDINFEEYDSKKDNNSIFSILEDEPVAEKYYISDYETNVLSVWDEFYKNINRKVLGFPIWVEYFKKLPTEDMPKWKQNFIEKNNILYTENRGFIDKWLKKNSNLENFTPTHRKFEWQAGESIESVWEGVIQFRPSGIRVKKPNCFPALVAMVQIPIIGQRKRRLTVREAARLQSFPENFILDDSDQQAYKQFGNAVNVEVIRVTAKKLFSTKL